ncbi:hypothetical protein VNO78_08839 [Psophocarpus tetragonolobus]|uniref:Ubiquitin carboxyl-terminal hydrolase n=1 Tax=Psophocarpus tetragonolobus TaxID=3891 RepID=A0AAN9SWJ6_PSOTE
MCFSVSQPAITAAESMGDPPPPSIYSEAPSDTDSDADSGHAIVKSPTPADSGIPVGEYGDDPPREGSGVSSSFRQLNDNSSSLWSSALASNSHISADQPKSWIASEGNWLLAEDLDSRDAECVTEDVPSKMVGAGLWNLGNTCYLNAILQCFTHTVPLVQGLRACTHTFPCASYEDGFCVICAFRCQVDRSIASSGQALKPLIFVHNLNYFSSVFTRYQQEDAHEFMQCALDKLEGCYLDLRKSNLNFEDDNLVEKVFGGRLISKLRCCSCDHTSDTFEPLIDMSLEIENVDSLPSALESFTKVEKIDASFKCDSCKEEVSTEKQLMLDQTPLVAAFHLKRFKTDGTHVEKIDKHIDFPLELDLQPYTISNQNDVPLKYDLYAIVVHTGFSSTSGHYFCFVRSAPDTWHKLDDSMVTKVSADSVLSQEAYILFYAQHGTQWFSSIMESQTECLDPNVMHTSPKSVLDVGDSMSKPNPIIISNTGRGCASESKDSEPQLDQYREENGFLEVNDTNDAAHGSEQLPSRSNQESIELKSSRVDAQKLFRKKTTLDDRAMCDRNSYINGTRDNKEVVYDNEEVVHDSEEVVDFGENACFHALTPPNSPPNDASDKFYTSHDNLKKTKHGSCKKSSNKSAEDSQRRAAMNDLNKMIGSRRGALLKFVTQQDQVLDKKRKQMDSSQCKKNNLGERKKSNHTSVSRPVCVFWPLNPRLLAMDRTLANDLPDLGFSSPGNTNKSYCWDSRGRQMIHNGESILENRHCLRLKGQFHRNQMTLLSEETIWKALAQLQLFVTNKFYDNAINLYI